MIDIIYNFIRNDFIGESSTIAGADTLALIMTWSVIVMIFFIFVKLVMWAFNVSFKNRKYRS